MKDSYSFDIDAAGLDAAYDKHYRAYCRIFDRCGLEYVAVEAHSGAMGGSQSHEFMVASDAGEDYVARCPQCGYSANMEKAVSRPRAPPLNDPGGDLTPSCSTPRPQDHRRGRRLHGTARDLPDEEPGAWWPTASPLLALLRGDHQLSETKFGSVTGDPDFAPRIPEEIREWFGAEAGSLGPVGVKNMPVLADKALRDAAT